MHRPCSISQTSDRISYWSAVGYGYIRYFNFFALLMTLLVYLCIHILCFIYLIILFSSGYDWNRVCSRLAPIASDYDWQCFLVESRPQWHGCRYFFEVWWYDIFAFFMILMCFVHSVMAAGQILGPVIGSAVAQQFGFEWASSAVGALFLLYLPAMLIYALYDRNREHDMRTLTQTLNP